MRHSIYSVNTAIVYIPTIAFHGIFVASQSLHQYCL